MSGALGHGEMAHGKLPKKVPGIGSAATAVMCGAYHSAIIDQSGTVLADVERASGAAGCSALWTLGTACRTPRLGRDPCTPTLKSLTHNH